MPYRVGKTLAVRRIPALAISGTAFTHLRRTVFLEEPLRSCVSREVDIMYALA